MAHAEDHIICPAWIFLILQKGVKNGFVMIVKSKNIHVFFVVKVAKIIPLMVSINVMKYRVVNFSISIVPHRQILVQFTKTMKQMRSLSIVDVIDVPSVILKNIHIILV